MDYEPIFFPSGADFRVWLEANHDATPELWLGFHRKKLDATA